MFYRLGFYDAYYRRAQKVRNLIKRDFQQVFDMGVEAILTPTTPSAAFALGDETAIDPIKMYLNDVFTVTVNLAGLPAISLPAGLDCGRVALGFATDWATLGRGRIDEYRGCVGKGFCL